MSNYKGCEVDYIIIPERLSWRLRLVSSCLVSDLLPFLLSNQIDPLDQMIVTQSTFAL
jgi:hypothetical protein